MYPALENSQDGFSSLVRIIRIPDEITSITPFFTISLRYALPRTCVCCYMLSGGTGPCRRLPIVFLFFFSRVGQCITFTPSPPMHSLRRFVLAKVASIVFPLPVQLNLRWNPGTLGQRRVIVEPALCNYPP